MLLRYTRIANHCGAHDMLAIRLPQDIENRLEALAAATGRTKTFYAREAILEHIDNLEDIYLAEQRLADVRAGRSKTMTLEELEQQYGVED
ncbi:type II toxin-antitoxin system RelB family antitoxin [Pseudomonas asplenii]|uniref:type II toxin-antitoxin system RelB family antitoxin n=1 Tax=Pseudomonas asplenii TaxID=53407 RepID=UPI002FC3756C